MTNILLQQLLKLLTMPTKPSEHSLSAVLILWLLH